MERRRNDCDREKLRLSLEGRLAEAGQMDLAAHLEACAACRRELEQMAAASQYWGDVALLRGEPAPGGSPTGPLPPEMLGSEDEADSGGWLGFLDPPAPESTGTLGRLARYTVLEVLGRGGMGTVLKAHDPSLDRAVAIKVLASPLSHVAMARRRFEREAKAVAAVGHEHIVAIHAVDEFRGLPYLVMEYVPGRSLQEKLDQSGPLEVREVVRIGTQAARALAAAHAQGVVHRDIKPANILLENCVERVKLTDFGLARAIDDASLTHSGLIAGTPQYMAPEQARGEAVDARADLFALGSVLYAMAAGRSPFRADSAMAVLRRVCDDRHRPIRELNPDVPAWLAATIDRLLAKEADDRFATAGEVADLLERGLAHLQQPTILPAPVVPGSDGDATGDRGDLARGRPLRRMSMAAAFAALSLAGLGAGEAAGLTQVSQFVATVFRIKTADGALVIKVDDPDVKVQIDGETVIIGGAGPEEIRLRAGSHHVRAIKDGKAVRDQIVTIKKGGKEIVDIAFEPEPEAAETSPTARKWLAPPTPADPTRLGPPGGTATDHRPNPEEAARARAMVWSLAYSPDGSRLAIAQQAIDRPESILRIRDLARRSDEKWFLHDNSGFRSVAFSTDGKTLEASVFDGTLMTLENAGGWKVHHSENQGSPINAVVFLPNSPISAAGDWDGWVRFHGPDEIANRSPLRYPGRIWSLAVSPDGKLLAIGGESNKVHVFDLPYRQLRATLKGFDHAVESLDFSPDGKRLASAGGRLVRIWDTATWKEIGGPIQHAPEVICVRFSPDGRLLAISDGESFLPHYNVLSTSIMLWDVAAGAEVRRLWGHTNTIWALAFSPDGKTLASGSADQTVKFWDVAGGKLRETLVPGESEAGPAAGTAGRR